MTTQAHHLKSAWMVPVLFVMQIFLLPHWAGDYLEFVGGTGTTGNFDGLMGLFSCTYLTACLFSRENQSAGRFQHVTLSGKKVFLLPLLVLGLDLMLQEVLLKSPEAWPYWMGTYLLKIGLGIWLDSQNGFFVHRHWWPKNAPKIK